MALEDINDDDLLFKLVDKAQDTSFFIQTASADQKQIWTAQIHQMLDMQGNFMKGRPTLVIIIFHMTFGPRIHITGKGTGFFQIRQIFRLERNFPTIAI